MADLAQMAPLYAICFAVAYEKVSDGEALLTALAKELDDWDPVVFVVTPGKDGETIGNVWNRWQLPSMASFVGNILLSKCKTVSEIPEMIEQGVTMAGMLVPGCGRPGRAASR